MDKKNVRFGAIEWRRNRAYIICREQTKKCNSKNRETEHGSPILKITEIRHLEKFLKIQTGGLNLS